MGAPRAAGHHEPPFGRMKAIEGRFPILSYILHKNFTRIFRRLASKKLVRSGTRGSKIGSRDARCGSQRAPGPDCREGRAALGGLRFEI